MRQWAHRELLRATRTVEMPDVLYRHTHEIVQLNDLRLQSFDFRLQLNDLRVNSCCTSWLDDSAASDLGGRYPSLSVPCPATTRRNGSTTSCAEGTSCEAPFAEVGAGAAHVTSGRA